MTASRSACLASKGKCSLMRTPGALVLISWNGPPFSRPGLRSKVSICEGPPFIHKRMHERLRFRSFAVPSARAFSQPDIEKPITPAADSVSHSRRERGGIAIGESPRLVVHFELRAVEQHPEDVGEGGRLVLLLRLLTVRERAALIDVL